MPLTPEINNSKTVVKGLKIIFLYFFYSIILGCFNTFVQQRAWKIFYRLPLKPPQMTITVSLHSTCKRMKEAERGTAFESFLYANKKPAAINCRRLTGCFPFISGIPIRFALKKSPGLSSKKYRHSQSRFFQCSFVY